MSFDWINRDIYLEHPFPQLTNEWWTSHNGILTSGNFGAAAGHSPFTTPDKLAHDINSYHPKTPDEWNKMKSLPGIAKESVAKSWYERTYDVKIQNVSLCIPKWNTKIGASPDGFIIGTDSAIEIKCPEKIPGPILQRIKLKQKGHKFSPYDHSHIFQTVYDQMQCLMKITGKKSCVYLIYVDDNTNYVETIPFNQNYWDNELYPKIQNFIAKYL